MTRPAPRLALLTNVVAPYRLPLYRSIARAFDLHILVAGLEANRQHWDAVDLNIPGARVKRSWGVTFARVGKTSSGVIDHRHLHLTPGYLADLIRIAPQVIVSNEMGARTIMALLYGLATGTPVWIWWGGTLHTERNASLIRRVIRKALSRSPARWISYGGTSTEYLASLGIAAERILQIQNCVDDSMFVRTRPVRERSTPPRLLCVSRLVALKGIPLLLRSAARLRTRGYMFCLQIVGDGPLSRELRELSSSLGLSDTEFLPERSPRLMPAIYENADALVFPTLSDVWGLVVNEALLMGVPVISSIYAGCTTELVPIDNRFDPLDDASFDRALISAVTGALAPADPTPLRTARDVGVQLVAALQRSAE